MVIWDLPLPTCRLSCAGRSGRSISAARALYSNLAARKGVTPEEVGITAACSLLRRVSVGEYYLLARAGGGASDQVSRLFPYYCA